MKSLFLLFIVAISSLDCLLIQFDYKCDFRFGDGSWNYSEVFFNKDFFMQPDVVQLSVFLDKSKGHMINFVCVNLDGTPTSNAAVGFHPLNQTVTVELRKHSENGVDVHILAKQHGY